MTKLIPLKDKNKIPIWNNTCLQLSHSGGEKKKQTETQINFC